MRFVQAIFAVTKIGWSRMSARRTSGSSRPSLGVQVLPSLPSFLGKIAVQEMSGKTSGSPRHPSSRHPRPSERRKPLTIQLTLLSSCSKTSEKAEATDSKHVCSDDNPPPRHPKPTTKSATNFHTIPCRCLFRFSWCFEMLVLRFLGDIHGFALPKKPSNFAVGA